MANRRSTKCSDCGTKWSQHIPFNREPSTWTALDVLALVENEWENNPSVPSREFAYSTVARQLLWELAAHGLHDAVVRELTLAVWRWGETPGRALTPKRWLKLFRQGGHAEVDNASVDEGRFAHAAPRPEAPVSLRRGAPMLWRNGLAWTTSRQVADFYAYGRIQRDGMATSVWEIRDVPSERILGRVIGSEDGDGELIIDPTASTSFATRPPTRPSTSSIRT
ncbi:hypothetical protein GCM10023216_02630 [Isoptericola chiayiensis]|uniref:Uncharacterized protein n=1 Tax=Isoptericola chiayiensis TaxID=579446 RepID=A0ABP8XY73_9MICO|nr:hypothetical protein [Isoptericola chiayiensis]NOW01082.1 hypothetical protein [Isoptericola chiayiensis]